MKNILIREVPSEVVEIIEAFKKQHDFKVNTDAVMTIIRKYATLVKSFEEQKMNLSTTTTLYVDLHEAVQRYLENQEAVETTNIHLSKLVKI